MPILVGIHSKATTNLADYFEEERGAESHNSSSHEFELQMADHLFLAAQDVFVAFQWRDTKPHRVLASLMCSCTKYFASAVGICLRGNPAEAVTIMRSSMEAAAYATKIRENPDLADLWVNSEDSPREFRKSFGRDSDLMKQPIMKHASETYSAFSTFGTHARFVRTIDSINLEAEGMGWRLCHAKTNDFYCRFQLQGILFTMRDIVDGPLKQGFLEVPYPESVENRLASFESIRADLGKAYPEFVGWVRGQPKIDWRMRSTKLVLATMQIALKVVENPRTPDP